jgi:glutamate carboxypeptidase
VSNVVSDRARAEIEVRLFTADGLQAATHLLEEVACLPMVTGRPARVEPVVPADGADGRGPAPP